MIRAFKCEIEYHISAEPISGIILYRPAEKRRKNYRYDYHHKQRAEH